MFNTEFSKTLTGRDVLPPSQLLKVVLPLRFLERQDQIELGFNPFPVE